MTAEPTATSPSTTGPIEKGASQSGSGGLDDVLLAMDVVDTLRHREERVALELDAEAREDALIERLRAIYDAQGIAVPDRILRDGVKALEEQRFVYTPPGDGLMLGLARLYVSRGRWLRPVAAILGAAALGTAGWHFGVAAPRAAAERQVERELTVDLPAEIAAIGDRATALATTDAALLRVESTRQDALAAAARGEAAAARQGRDALLRLEATLRESHTIRVVSRPGEQSGVFRIPDDVPGARNYYLIVEAVRPDGTIAPVTVTSEETQATRTVRRWGLRVPEATFDAVAADKRDDQIIQNAAVGTKPRGALEPVYAVDTDGGAILDW